MSTVANTSAKETKKAKHPLDRTFASVEEAAQAKTDYVWDTVLKNVDWDKLEEMRKNK